MPRDLFGDVTRPSISVGNRKWYTVPASLLSHAIILAVIVIVPILAAPMMPGVLDNTTVYHIVDLVPPTPPRPPKTRAEPIKPIEQPGTPIEAPTGISDEKPAPEPAEPYVPSIVEGPIKGSGELLAPPRLEEKVPPVPVRPGFQGVRNPVKTHHIDPVYPPIAQSARIQGIVIIEATLGIDGRVTNARILRSVPLLDQAALDAVRQWEFTPTLLNGAPVPVIMTVTVNFTLSR